MAKKITGISLFQQFATLSEAEQSSFVNECVRNPPNAVRSRLDKQAKLDSKIHSIAARATIGHQEKEIETIKKRIPQKKGESRRDEIILRLHADGWTAGRIARNADVLAAHRGKKKLKARTVQKVIDRKKGQPNR